jgi:AcrR family transcriptional regulator
MYRTEDTRCAHSESGPEGEGAGSHPTQEGSRELCDDGAEDGRSGGALGPRGAAMTGSSTLDGEEVGQQAPVVTVQARFPKLKPSPKGPSRDEVERDQRLRLCAAMIELAAEHGYAAVTVRQLSKLARVSTRDFYERFGGKEQCFLHAYQAIAQSAERRIAEAYQTEADPRAALESSMRALLSEVVRRPKATRVALVESFAVGPAALLRVRSVERRFAARLALSLERVHPEVAAPPAAMARAIVAGLVFAIRTRLLEERAHELPAITEDLVAWMLSYCGADVSELFAAARCVPLLPVGTGRSMTPAAPAGCVTGAGGWAAAGEERARLMAAAACLAASDGYAALKPQAILAAAGLPRGCFQTHFENVQGCVLAALEEMMERALREATSAVRGVSRPSDVRTAIDELTSRFVTDPVLAQLVFVETVIIGAAGITRCTAMMAAASQALDGGAAGERHTTKRLIHEAAVGAAWCVAHECVLAGELSQLTQLRNGFAFLILAPAMGARAAAAAVQQTAKAATPNDGAHVGKS